MYQFDGTVRLTPKGHVASNILIIHSLSSAPFFLSSAFTGVGVWSVCVGGTECDVLEVYF